MYETVSFRSVEHKRREVPQGPPVRQYVKDRPRTDIGRRR
ncbi:hypothetical protein SLNWT_4417 [Streptomyces albus]|uniref:Uncharacterized protein n=1 Tax=Streptomyces albus (strain ATCC 21838 / DSM 41398 / FERM P-419 / JCM 4703 / NBRC 107858) TaxID=1081613 RepID=A0A0B5EPW6_STRA4|nr:hypothetical protein SLNWT_4417 [Streptomyces albus]